MSRKRKYLQIAAPIYWKSGDFGLTGRKMEIDSKEVRDQFIEPFSTSTSASTTEEWNVKFQKLASNYIVTHKFFMELMMLAVRTRNKMILDSRPLIGSTNYTRCSFEMDQLFQACEETKCKGIMASVVITVNFMDKSNHSRLHLVTPLLLDAMLDVYKATDVTSVTRTDGLIHSFLFIDQLITVATERQLADYIADFTSNRQWLNQLMYAALHVHGAPVLFVFRQVNIVLNLGIQDGAQDAILKIAIDSTMDARNVCTLLTHDVAIVDLLSLFNGTDESQVMLVKLIELGINLRDLLTDTSKPNYVAEVARAERFHSQLTQCLTDILGRDLTGLVLQYW